MNQELSVLLSSMEGSKILDFVKKIEKFKNKGIDVIRLDIGDPDFPTPSKIIEAAYRAMKEGYTHYGPPLGIPELRLELARSYNKKIENVIITPGSKQGVFYSLRAILNSRDEIITFIPGWLEYKGPIILSNGKIVFAKCNNEFQPDIDDLKKKITPRTKAILINTPNNPTGVVYEEKILKEIAEIALENNLFVISDEIYSKLIYGIEYPSISKFMKLEDGLIIVNGFSKTYAMTGWRLGYVIAHEKIIEAISKIQVHTAVAPNTFGQYAALVALKECESDVKSMVYEFDRRRRFLIDFLKEGEIEFVEPKGAFYFFIDLTKYLGKRKNIAEYILEKAKVALVSGEVFGEGYEGYVRISYTTKLERIELGMKNLLKILLSS